jgi:rhodanese-related sulfurtransferase
MDEVQHSISPIELYGRLGTASAPLVVDVRGGKTADDRSIIVSAFQLLPEEVECWDRDRLGVQSVVVYCEQGRDTSQRLAARLRSKGLDSAYLEGGFGAWAESGLPTRRVIGATPGKWVTRERPKIDRIACPWLIRRFIDPGAEFVYVPAHEVIATAKTIGATPYDIDGVEFSHEGARCSFDTIIRIYGIEDAPLQHLAEIVRGADTSRHDLAPQCSGLFAISLGLSANFPDDHAMLAHGMDIYDALYRWCRDLQIETHNWPPKGT